MGRGPVPSTRKKRPKLVPWQSFLRPNGPETAAVQAVGSGRRLCVRNNYKVFFRMYLFDMDEDSWTA